MSNILNSSPLKESARGGFADYEYPRWSTILGWFIFVGCVIPIPIVFLVRYIEQYRRIAAQRRVGILHSNNPPNPILGNQSPSTPIYLAALAANNSPSETWGPRRRKDQQGIYAHLRPQSAHKSVNEMENNLNPTFIPDQPIETSRF